MRKKYFMNVALVALVICGPLLMPGYILTLDMVFGPHFMFEFDPQTIIAPLPVFYVIHLLGYVIPIWFIQKMIILGIFILAGLSMRVLLDKLSWNAQFVGILAYMLNPFVYYRFLAGQWLFLLGYALFPLWIAALFKFYNRLDRNSFLVLFLISNLLITASFHFFWIALLFGAVSLFQYWKKLADARFLRGIAVFVLGSLIVQSYWIAPLLVQAHLWPHDVVGQFGMFVSSADSILLTFLGYGFWGETGGFGSQFINPSHSVMIFFGFCLLLISIFGLFKKLKSDTHKQIVLFSGLMGLMLSMLTLLPFVQTMYAHIPGFVIMRDMHKFVMLWMVALAVGLAYGFEYLSGKMHNRVHENILVLCFGLCIVLHMWPMLGGFGGQLKSVRYPDSWYSVDEILKETPNNQVLVLPWNTYMSFSFNDNVLIHQPAFRFFENPVIYNRNATMNGDVVQYKNAEHVEDMLADGMISSEELPINSYVLVYKEPGFEYYSISLPSVLETDDLVLYQNL